MDNQPVVEKTAEGKYAFESQQQYDQALESMIANPSSMEDLQGLMNLENVVLGSSNSGQPESAPLPQAEEPALAGATPPAETPVPSVPQNLVERLRQKAKDQGVDFTYQNEDHIIDGIINKEKRIKFLNEQRQNMVTKDELQKAVQEKEELEARLSKMQETPPATPTQQPEQSNVSQSKKPEIDVIRKRLKEIDDPYSDEGARLQRDLNDLMIAELERVETLKSQTGDSNNDEVLSLIRDVRKEVNEFKSKSAATEEEARTMRKYQEDLRAIEDLQKVRPEFKTDRSLKEMDKSYRDWASELFYLKNQRKPESTAEMNLAAQDFLAGDPDIKLSARQAGVEEPSDVKQYLEICDLLTLRDKLTDAVGTDHTLEQVLVYKMARDGSINDAMMQQRQLGAEAIKNGQQNRDTNYAKQLDHKAGATPEQAGDEMTIEQAMQVMQKITPERAERNPADKALLDQAFATWKTKAMGS